MPPRNSSNVPNSATQAAMREARQMQPPAGQLPSLLQRADDLINGHRQQDYGDKLQNFSQIAMMIQGVLAHKLLPSSAISPEDVAAIMICVKLSRVAKSPDHTDSWLDIAGYAGCVDILQQERATGAALLGATADSRNGTQHF